MHDGMFPIGEFVRVIKSQHSFLVGQTALVVKHPGGSAHAVRFEPHLVKQINDTRFSGTDREGLYNIRADLLELARPLTSFERSLHSYIRRELNA